MEKRNRTDGVREGFVPAETLGALLRVSHGRERGGGVSKRRSAAPAYRVWRIGKTNHEL